jgi:hypothetical protein
MSLILGEYLYGWSQYTHCPKDFTSAPRNFTWIDINNVSTSFIVLECVPDSSYIGTDPEKKLRDDIVLGVILGVVLPLIIYVFGMCMCGRNPFWCCCSVRAKKSVDKELPIVDTKFDTKYEDNFNKIMDEKPSVV